MLALVESESSFGAYVCHGRPGGSLATSDLVGASLSEPHSYVLTSTFVIRDIYIYIYIY